MRHACVAACNFDCLHELMTSNMETGQPAEPTTPDRWQSVAVSNWCLVVALACLVYSEPSNHVDELLLVLYTACHHDVNELLLLPGMHLRFALLSCIVCFTLKCFGSACYGMALCCKDCEPGQPGVILGFSLNWGLSVFSFLSFSKDCEVCVAPCLSPLFCVSPLYPTPSERL